MLVSRISPAPLATHVDAHSTASIPVGFFPPFTYTSQSSLPVRRRASMLATTH